MNWFKKIMKRFQKNYICPRCNELTYGNELCLLCTKYENITQRQQMMDAKAKDELKRRDWIRHRNEFLENNDG